MSMFQRIMSYNLYILLTKDLPKPSLEHHFTLAIGLWKMEEEELPFTNFGIDKES